MVKSNWRIAKSLEKLRSQVNAEYPKRDKSSDGTIGDAAHASRSSDHNPWVKDGTMGVVTGMDITNDPKNGVVSGDLAEALLASRDSRIKYIISNARICSGDAGPSPWVWRKYSGANAHRHHVHLSVKSDKRFYDAVKPWSFAVKPAKFIEPIATIEEPQDNEVDYSETCKAAIKDIQTRLKKMNYNPGIIDGCWGSGISGALSGFLNDRPLTMAAPTSLEMFMEALPDLKAELSEAEAEGFIRPVSEKRASGDLKTVAAVAPEVVPTRRNFLAAVWAAITAFFSAIVTSISDYISHAWDFFTDHKDSLPTDPSLLGTAKDYLASVPTSLWIALAGCGFAFLAYNAFSGMKNITTSVQSGARQ